jgi:hypothetical protein
MSDSARQETAKRLSPAYPFSLAFICLALTVYAQLTYVYRPVVLAGQVMSLTAAGKNAAIWFECISLGMATLSIYLGISAFHDQVRKRFTYSAIAYFLVLAVFLVIGVAAVLSEGEAC